MIAEAEAGASPDVGAAADDARADPEEVGVRLVDVGLFEVVDVPAGVPLAHGVGTGLDGAFAFERALGAGPVGQAVDGDVLLVVGVGQRPPGFEDGDAEARFRQTLGGPPARGAGTDNDDVKRASRYFRLLHKPRHLSVRRVYIQSPPRAPSSWLAERSVGGRIGDV